MQPHIKCFLSDFSGTSIGIAFSDFLTDSLPQNQYDIPVDMIATEQGVIFIREKARYTK